MILAFLDDGTVELHNSAETAIAACEGIDVESSVVQFFDHCGKPLKPVFTVPNRHGNFLGLIRWSQSGTYHLEQDTSGDGDPLWVALAETSSVEGDQFDSIDHLKDFLRSNGAVVDRP